MLDCLPTASALAASPGPGADAWVRVAEYDAVFRWHIGDATTADGFRVIDHTGGTAGRWILDGPGLTLSPLGGGADDWARLMAGACAAMAYKGNIYLRAGAWRCDSKQTIVSGTRLWGNSGVTIASTLTANVPPGSQDASVFYNWGGSLTDTSTLTVAGAPGNKSVTVANGALYAVGNQVNLRCVLVPERRCLREITAVVGNVLSLDRPLLRPFAIGDVVGVIPTARDIKIYGGGMTITGTGDSALEMVAARDCVVTDIKLRSTGGTGFTYYGFGFDIGSRDCVFERIDADMHGLTPVAIYMAHSENGVIRDCHTRGAVNVNLMLQSLDNAQVVGGTHVEPSPGAICLGVGSDVAGLDTIGCRGCVVTGGMYGGGGFGVYVESGSSDCDFVGVESSDNTNSGFLITPGLAGAAPQRIRVLGGVAKRNAVAAVYCSSGKGHAVIGHSAIDNGQADGNTYVASGAGVEADLANCTIIDNATAQPNARGQCVVLGAGAILRATAVTLRAGARVGRSEMFEVQGGGLLVVRDCAYSLVSASVTSIGVLVASGLAVVDGFRTGVCAYGFFLNGAAARARIGDGVDVSLATAGKFIAIGGATLNRGQVTLTGSTPVVVAFGDTKSTDRFLWHYVSAAAPSVPSGVVVAGAPIPGTGFSIAGIAGDTSIINYEIR